ncbi:MAG: response regulator [Alphaproteobacteria bacterium]|nr:response regulator [Alphaproteobacteria bacterium]
MPDKQPSPVKILVVDDNPSVREYIERSFAVPGYAVSSAIDGQEALDLLSRENFDALVSDIVMPNVDGVALAMKAAQLYPSLRIVMVSGYVQERVRAVNLESLVHKVISKPFSPEEIREAVDSVLSVSKVDGNDPTNS